MTFPVAPPDEDTQRWADLAARAEAADQNIRADADIDADPWNGAEGATPALRRWLGGGVQHEELLFEWERAAAQIAKWQAVQMRVLAEGLEHALADRSLKRDAHLAVRSLAAEFACAVAMSDRTIEQHMNDASILRDRFSDTFQTLAAGEMSRAHALVIVESGARLDDAGRAEYERLVLERRGNLTTGRLRAMATAIAEELMPASLADRHADARAGRLVERRDLDDGMSELRALLPSPLAHGIFDRLTQMGRTIQDAERQKRDAAHDPAAGRCIVGDQCGGGAKCVGGGSCAGGGPCAGGDQSVGETRTLDQLRADVLCDLLLTGHPTAPGIDRDGGAGIDAIRAIVQITVPVQTLMGVADGGAQLTGRCPIDPESARRIAGAATIWDRVLTDPFTGDVIDVDRRFPTAAQQRHLRARDEHCRFPGCRMAVWRCDIDHTRDHQHGGQTEACNLSHLCRRHHVLKHQTAWRLEQRDRGVLVWTSPLGRTYEDCPPPSVRFVPD